MLTFLTIASGSMFRLADTRMNQAAIMLLGTGNDHNAIADRSTPIDLGGAMLLRDDGGTSTSRAGGTFIMVLRLSLCSDRCFLLPAEYLFFR